MNIKLKDEKEWLIKEYDAEAVKRMSEELGLSPFLARLLAARGISDTESARDFLSTDDFYFHDPYLLEDMDKATKRIKTAIAGKERILIYGDYDVDGISSVAALYLYLTSKGANVCYYIPERVSEGYGLNKDAIDKFSAAHIDLIITVDTGITSVGECAYIKQLGMSIVITDHHECPLELPAEAEAIINPKRPGSRYPFKELAGVGVVFKLICALEEKADISELCDRYLDIVTLGTIADVMPLYGENRRIVAHGLKVLNDENNVGIKALLTEAVPAAPGVPRNITASTIGFAVAPRLNAAGRIGDVKYAAELLITSNKLRAEEIAKELCRLNRERQAIENSILAEAAEKIKTEFDSEKDKVIVLASENWHQGVIGIVASRIVEKYGLPCVLITFSDNTGKGSARSIAGFNINEAFRECKETLLKYGGHELAAGLSIKKECFEDFKKAINDYAFEKITDEMRIAHIYADSEITEEEIDTEHAEMLKILEPFGNSNPAPVFILREALIEDITPIGMNKHLRLSIEKSGKRFTAVYFNKTPEKFGFLQGDTADIAFNLEINEFRGNRTVRLNVRDMKISGITAQYMNRQAKDYLRAIASFAVSKENLPDMQALRAAFIYLRSMAKEEKTTELDVCKAARSISKEFAISVTPCMLNIMLDIFSEMGLIVSERYSLNEISVGINSINGKINIENSRFLTKLRNSGK